MIGNIPVKTAAKILGISAFSVQCGLRSGKLPIGTCWKNDNSNEHKYLISPALLASFQGITVEEIEKIVKGEQDESKDT
ncbi:MAG: hypothetical protein NC088_06150 [Bacteroides sp.]|nr:hypothetical protein [Bacteroides sp.]